MLPIIKWTGGKRKEIMSFRHYLPKEFDLYVEPFAGGAALFWHLSKCGSVINDFDPDLINFYRSVPNKDFLDRVKEIKKLSGNHDEMEKLYYEFRDTNKKGLTPVEKAVRFCYVNQLAFSGMRRFNSDGEFNIPFGHYSKFRWNVLPKHITLLECTTILNEDAITLLPRYDNDGTFIFLDPPYTRVFNQYSANNIFGKEHHINLCNAFKLLKASKCMLIIDDSKLTRSLYEKYIKSEYSVNYGANLRNRVDTGSNHLIITNYDNEDDFMVPEERSE